MAALYFDAGSIANTVRAAVDHFVSNKKLPIAGAPKDFVVEINRRLAEARELVVPQNLKDEINKKINDEMVH